MQTDCQKVGKLHEWVGYTGEEYCERCKLTMNDLKPIA